ncbi:hypothetical protein Tco_1300598 [Tanacetum coccineum]
MGIKTCRTNVGLKTLWPIAVNGSYIAKELKEKSIHEKEILDIVEEEVISWIDTNHSRSYLTKEILPGDTKKARAVRRKAVSAMTVKCNRPSRNPQAEPDPITSTGPFYKWGIDIADSSGRTGLATLEETGEREESYQTKEKQFL